MRMTQLKLSRQSISPSYRNLTSYHPRKRTQTTMAAPGPNAELIAAASEFAAAVKDFNGDPVRQRQLLKEADRLRLLLETPMDTLMKQWEMSQCIAAMNLLVELDVLEAIPKEGSISSKDLAAIVKVDESAIGGAICEWI